MICPVCEHQQDFGLECDVCGKALGGLDALGAPPARTEVVEGLEHNASPDVGEVLVERVGELEVTHFAPVQVAEDRTPDVEHNAALAVGEVPVERLSDLSVDRVPDDGVRTALPQGPIVCRFCRTPNAGGSLCTHCGMKLPVVIIVPRNPQASAPTGEKTRCRACGAPATIGERCGDCGHLVADPDA